MMEDNDWPSQFFNWERQSVGNAGGVSDDDDIEKHEGNDIEKHQTFAWFAFTYLSAMLATITTDTNHEYDR